jgi:hypothetical protein
MASLLVTVSQNAVIKAESAISNCSRCAAEASTPFWHVLDNQRNHSGQDVTYFLPVLASCPNCRASIDETTLVSSKQRLSRYPAPVLVQNEV